MFKDNTIADWSSNDIQFWMESYIAVPLAENTLVHF